MTAFEDVYSKAKLEREKVLSLIDRELILMFDKIVSNSVKSTEKIMPKTPDNSEVSDNEITKKNKKNNTKNSNQDIDSLLDFINDKDDSKKKKKKKNNTKNGNIPNNL